MSDIHLRFAIAPDVHPDYLSGWHIFLRYLQKQLQVRLNITTYENFGQLRQGLENDALDLVFASAADCSFLVQQKHFQVVARPENDVTEVMVLCREDEPWQSMDDMHDEYHAIACVDSPEVQQLGLILLECADIDADHIDMQTAQNHLQAVKYLMNGTVDLAFVPTDVYHSWSATLRKSVRPLVQTMKDDVEVLSHVLLLSPQYPTVLEPLKNILNDLNGNTYQGMLQDINIRKWRILNDNSDIDFLIDLVDTLQI
ncbi:phosphate/phosphite/phosphonate ABC transporter substrate-binding protein [Vitreoscilla stercoraria]|uniref:PhnD/SsuA/transferrin family substrate-binding protein n=1 Tax=Vitreoscilla stercoraria TaxID=61 RepID=A0ABY4EAF1_VITST|nr:PhnD/SsuA/transferrin family substrate-binding protein [Vitreoscilla stercoraria]UOO91905.1 PhnD/SsuA/transferrin family substrate-binding protein [Vitreoscilla stercoraria]